MGTVNLVKLIELYKEILSTYITEDDILIVDDSLNDKEILDRVVSKNYIKEIISTITKQYIYQDVLVITGRVVDELIDILRKEDNDFIKHPCLFKILYTLYNKIIHLQQKG